MLKRLAVILLVLMGGGLGLAWGAAVPEAEAEPPRSGAAEAPVEALPDAQVVRISAAGRGFREGERVRMTVEVRNGGEARLPRVPVELAVDEVTYATWDLPRELGPGESVEWRLSYEGTRGMHLVRAVVDPLNDVREGEEGNNSAFINLGVGEAGEGQSWLVVVVGLAFFGIGAAAGALLRRAPAESRPRRRRATGRSRQGASRSGGERR